jgi:hypothetical protein
MVHTRQQQRLLFAIIDSGKATILKKASSADGRKESFKGGGG